MNGFKFISDVTLQKKNIEHLDIANPFNLPFDKMPADNLLCDFEGISRIEELPDWKSKTLVGSTHWEIEKKMRIRKQPSQSRENQQDILLKHG